MDLWTVHVWICYRKILWHNSLPNLCNSAFSLPYLSLNSSHLLRKTAQTAFNISHPQLLQCPSHSQWQDLQIWCSLKLTRPNGSFISTSLRERRTCTIGHKIWLGNLIYRMNNPKHWTRTNENENRRQESGKEVLSCACASSLPGLSQDTAGPLSWPGSIPQD